jgi:hypothetical protein
MAKSYLQESNQLFVTRILGKTGYKPGKTYSVKTLGGVNLGSLSGSTTGITLSATTATITGSTIYDELSGKTASNGSSVTDYIVNKIGKSGTAYANNDWFVIGSVPSSDTSSLTGTKLLSPIGENTNKNWYNAFFTKTGSTDSTIDGVYSYLFVYSTSSSSFNVTRFKYNASLNTDYSDVIVLSLRSRGEYNPTQTLVLQVTGTTAVTLTDVGGVQNNPMAEFNLNVTNFSGRTTSFNCSLDTTSTKYVTKVLGTEVFDKVKEDYPLFVNEVYSNLLLSAYRRGDIRGLSLDVTSNDESDNFMQQWDTPSSPTIVSEVRGGNVADLFSILTISDGNSANTEIKITIQNINLDTAEFDIIVRDFNDTDENQVVLEKFSRCSMNPDIPGYVARKVGTSDGEYELRSKFIMLNMADNAPADALPAGFKGFTSSLISSKKLGSVLYKTEYFDGGDVIYYESDGSQVLSNGDKIKKVSLGLSSQNGFKFDSDLFKYKGNGASSSTFGFHLSTNASSITGTTYQTTSYDLEGQSGNDNKLTNINFRKFTLAVCGGFDGWDVYRETRTLGDQFIFGKTTYNLGEAPSGVFNSSFGNSDYYAYLEGIQTYSNPEAVDINVFATAGINFYDHSSLTSQAIDIIENERADSLYIISSPNVDDAATVTGYLDDLGIDSNYSATYWPWIQVRDTDNATQLYLPPTGEVLKNIALTDNVSYPWFAVAGYSRGLVNAIKAKKKLTLDERDELYKNRINPIATFSDTGTIIWGNKTLQVRESALDRINVRRLLLRARKLISAVAVRLLFEQNDEQVRQEFLRLVNPILESIKKERGLFEFRVSVSSDVEDIDANTLRGKIYVKPTRSLEFIDLEFVITPTGASFENI